MLVVAGPGSGKTTVMIQRISYLIEQRDIDPQKILVITFTREAAMNMRERFQAVHSTRYPVSFGTFHAVFYQIIKSSGRFRADTILTDSEKKRILLPILKDYMRDYDPEQENSMEFSTSDVINCLSAFAYYKNTMNMMAAAKRCPKILQKDFERIFYYYQKKQRKSGKLDYDDILYQCLQLLKEDRQLLRIWQNKYTYLLIDEMQDINPIQYKIIKLLAGENQNVFAVGDDDQSIYSFRGSEPVLMKQFLKEYSGCKQVSLDLNYRSTPAIVKASQKVVLENGNRFYKNLVAAREAKHNSGVVIRHFADSSSQYQFMIQEIKQMAAQEWPHAAILFRTHVQMQGMASALCKANIPFWMKEKGKCIYDHFIVQDINAYMQVSLGNRKRSTFMKIMNKPERGLWREALTSEVVSFEEQRRFYQRYAEGDEQNRLLQALRCLEADLGQMRELKPYLALQYLRKKVGYEAYLRKFAGADGQKLSEWLEQLAFVCEEVKEYDSYLEYLQYQEGYRKKMERSETAVVSRNAIQLMTVHGSKGLEFDHVWIPDINEGIYPHGRMITGETEEEERRILYVAMTRAKESLTLSFLTGTKERPRLMSRFLKPIMEYQI